MVTTRNSADEDTANSDGEGNHLLDELTLISKSSEHATNICGDMLIYVHEKPRCYNKCQMGISAVECEDYYKRVSEASL
jgi:hypothetical protein